MSHCDSCTGIMRLTDSQGSHAPCPGCGHEAEIAALEDERGNYAAMATTHAGTIADLIRERDALREDLRAVVEVCLDAQEVFVWVSQLIDGWNVDAYAEWSQWDRDVRNAVSSTLRRLEETRTRPGVRAVLETP